MAKQLEAALELGSDSSKSEEGFSSDEDSSVSGSSGSSIDGLGDVDEFTGIQPHQTFTQLSQFDRHLSASLKSSGSNSEAGDALNRQKSWGSPQILPMTHEQLKQVLDFSFAVKCYNKAQELVPQIIDKKSASVQPKGNSSLCLPNM